MAKLAIIPNFSSFGQKMAVLCQKLDLVKIVSSNRENSSSFGSGWNFSAILVAKQLFFQCYKILDTHIDHQRALSDHTVESMTYGRNQA